MGNGWFYFSTLIDSSAGAVHTSSASLSLSPIFTRPNNHALPSIRSIHLVTSHINLAPLSSP